MVAIDPSELVVRPNRGADAKDAHDREVLSDAALRQYLGFSEGDAPDEEEMLRRYTLKRSIGGMSLTRDLLPIIGYPQVPDAAEAAEAEAEAKAEGAAEGPEGPEQPDNPPEEGGPPIPAEPAAAARALLAAAGQQPLGERLSLIDSRLRERIQLAASEALNSALDRAGSRLRARAQGEPELRQRVNGRIPNDQVGVTLGDDGRALAAAKELIGEQDFAGLGEAFRAWVAQARQEALAVVRRVQPAVQAAALDPFERMVAEELGDTDSDDAMAWAHLLEALVHMGHSRIFTPDGTPDDGEFDPFVTVPPGPVRESLIIAGGGAEMSAAPSPAGKGAASGGPASGRKMIRFVHAWVRSPTSTTWATGAGCGCGCWRSRWR